MFSFWFVFLKTKRGPSVTTCLYLYIDACPVKTSSPGPVMYNLLSLSLHSIVKSPPGNETRHSRLVVFPARIAAAVRAQAPVPHANVAP